MLSYIADGLQSLATRLGTSADKAATISYALDVLDDQQLQNAFRTSWSMQKVVTIPALDAARKWREWSGDDADAIDALEDAFRVKAKTYEAKWKARLFGGAVILIGIRGQDLADPLVPGRIRKGDLEYLTVLSRQELMAGLIDIDPRSPRYGKPRDYQISTNDGQIVRVHPSRVAEFRGEPRPSINSAGSGQYGWDDSVLQRVYTACQNLDATMQNIAGLVFEAKTDIIKIPGLSENITDPKFEEQLLKRFANFRMIKGNQGLGILDGDEEYVSQSYSFSGLDSIADRFMQVAAGAAEIPMTRLLGMSPGGMNATGDHDLDNYYDRVSAMQTLEIEPTLTILDEVIVRSALGDWPEGLTYEWRPLKQMTEAEISEIRARDADTLSKLASSQLYDDADLAEAGSQMFRETGVDALKAPATDRRETDPLMGEPVETI